MHCVPRTLFTWPCSWATVSMAQVAVQSPVLNNDRCVCLVWLLQLQELLGAGPLAMRFCHPELPSHTCGAFLPCAAVTLDCPEGWRCELVRVCGQSRCGIEGLPLMYGVPWKDLDPKGGALLASYHIYQTLTQVCVSMGRS